MNVIFKSLSEIEEEFQPKLFCKIWTFYFCPEFDSEPVWKVLIWLIPDLRSQLKICIDYGEFSLASYNMNPNNLKSRYSLT